MKAYLFTICIFIASQANIFSQNYFIMTEGTKVAVTGSTLEFDGISLIYHDENGKQKQIPAKRIEELETGIRSIQKQLQQINCSEAMFVCVICVCLFLF